MRKISVAAIQMMCSSDRDENIAKAEALVRETAGKGAQIILLQELFETLYFCQSQKQDYFNLAADIKDNPAVQYFSELARELGVVLPISFFEKKNQAHYNTVAVVDADGAILGIYRKSHIPDGPGYQEKFYFSPGDTGFRVWKTRFGTIGIGICWDQWFPEAARSMVLLGAEVLLYPTAIGSEPQNPEYDSREHWQTCIQGHAAANMVPVVVSNRVGTESIDGSAITFYGSSFVTDNKGRLMECADRISETIVLSAFDLDAMAAERRAWGLFRDRRPALYTPLLSHDGMIGTKDS